jgi:hypothetical protein
MLGYSYALDGCNRLQACRRKSSSDGGAKRVEQHYVRVDTRAMHGRAQRSICKKGTVWKQARSCVLHDSELAGGRQRDCGMLSVSTADDQLVRVRQASASANERPRRDDRQRGQVDGARLHPRACELRHDVHRAHAQRPRRRSEQKISSSSLRCLGHK